MGTGGYFDTVLESGRVNGKLLIAVPHFQLSHIVMTPRKTLDSFGGIPSDMEKLNAYYDSLDSGLRSGGAYPEEFELMIDAGLDIPKAHVDLEDSVREWRSFLRKRIKDASPEAVGKYGVSLFEWSGTGGEPFFDLGSLENRYAEAGAAADGADAEAVLIPFPLRKDTGFVINTVSGAVPEKAAHAEAAKAYVSWLFSEVGQNEILNHRGEDEYPVALPVLKDAAHQWIDRQSAYGENAEGAEKERMQRENHENADRYIEKADRILANSWGFAKSVERVIFLRTAGEKDRRQEMTFIDEKTEGVLFRYAEAMTGKDATPRFHEDDTYDDWPAFIEGFIADYLADLGYEVTKAG